MVVVGVFSVGCRPSWRPFWSQWTLKARYPFPPRTARGHPIPPHHHHYYYYYYYQTSTSNYTLCCLTATTPARCHVHLVNWINLAGSIAAAFAADLFSLRARLRPFAARVEGFLGSFKSSSNDFTIEFFRIFFTRAWYGKLRKSQLANWKNQKPIL